MFGITPESILAASIMNGFDRGIEGLYSRYATSVTDGTATRDLHLLYTALSVLTTGAISEQQLYQTLVGTILVQYGISTLSRALLDRD
jgi:alcohol dehydrogenase